MACHKEQVTETLFPVTKAATGALFNPTTAVLLSSRHLPTGHAPRRHSRQLPWGDATTSCEAQHGLLRQPEVVSHIFPWYWHVGPTCCILPGKSLQALPALGIIGSSLVGAVRLVSRMEFATRDPQFCGIH